MFQRTRVAKMAAALAIVAAAMLLFSALAGTGVDAAKGGNTAGNHGGGKNGGGTPSGSATCAVTPNPATVYSQVTITGSGYAANGVYGLSVTSPSGSVYMGFIGSDGSGNLSGTYNTVWKGTNTVNVSGGGLAATCTFSVN